MMSINTLLNQFIFTSRGTSAIEALVKKAENITHIMIPVNVCEIVIAPLLNLQVEITFYDVDKLTGNATLAHIKESYDETQTALLAVHNFGSPLAIDAIKNWCNEQDVFLIEDVCNAIGATYQGQLLGTFGDAAIFSFGYAKIIENGIGGALLIADDDLHQKVVELIASYPVIEKEAYQHMDKAYQSQITTCRNNQNLKKLREVYQQYCTHFSYKLTDTIIQNIKSEIALLPNNIVTRNNIALQYQTHINNSALILIPIHKEAVVWRYTLLVNDANNRDHFIQHLRSHDILCSAWYPPIHHLFKTINSEKTFSNAMDFGKRVVNLFVDYRVNQTKVNQTISVINNYTTT